MLAEIGAVHPVDDRGDPAFRRLAPEDGGARALAVVAPVRGVPRDRGVGERVEGQHGERQTVCHRDRPRLRDLGAGDERAVEEPAGHVVPEDTARHHGEQGRVDTARERDEDRSDTGELHLERPELRRFPIRVGHFAAPHHRAAPGPIRDAIGWMPPTFAAKGWFKYPRGD